MTWTYTCALCGGTFLKGWSDAEADAEAVEVFGEVPADPEVTCDNCYQQIIGWAVASGQVALDPASPVYSLLLDMANEYTLRCMLYGQCDQCNAAKDLRRGPDVTADGSGEFGCPLPWGGGGSLRRWSDFWAISMGESIDRSDRQAGPEPGGWCWIHPLGGPWLSRLLVSGPAVDAH